CSPPSSTPLPTRRSSDLASKTGGRFSAVPAAIGHVSEVIISHCKPSVHRHRLLELFLRFIQAAKIEQDRTQIVVSLNLLRLCLRSEEHTSELQSPYDLVC